MKMEIAKWMPRWMTKMIVRLLKACMKFSPDHPHDRVLWVKLDIWQDDERDA
jgi:hypothetical protein